MVLLLIMANYPEGFTIGTRIPGHIPTLGKSAGIESNYAFEATDSYGSACILMYCRPNNYVILDNKDVLNKIQVYNNKRVTWYVMKCGYAGAHIIKDNKPTSIYLHQLLMDHSGKGKGQASIDHINQNKLDNRITNLRIATQSLQNSNRGKVSRHKNARKLPDEIANVTLPKFVVYYKEKVNSTTRDFFTVEGHPLQILKEQRVENSSTNQIKSRRWATTKSSKVSITDKLCQATEYLEELNKLERDNTYRLSVAVPNKQKVKEEKIPITSEGIDESSDESSETEEPLHVRQVKKSALKQWKARQIYDCFQANTPNLYKEFCENNNNTGSIDWNSTWETFVDNIRDKTFEQAKIYIDGFVALLRKLRHDKIIKNYNDKRYAVDKEGRQQWPAKSIVKAFNENKIELYKDWLIAQDTTIDEVKWTQFAQALSNADTEEGKLEVVQKYQRNRRSFNWRNKETTATN